MTIDPHHLEARVLILEDLLRKALERLAEVEHFLVLDVPRALVPTDEQLGELLHHQHLRPTAEEVERVRRACEQLCEEPRHPGDFQEEDFA